MYNVALLLIFQLCKGKKFVERIMITQYTCTCSNTVLQFNCHRNLEV